MKKHSDYELCEIINKRLELKANLRILDIPDESIRHIKEDCKKLKSARF